MGKGIENNRLMKHYRKFKVKCPFEWGTETNPSEMIYHQSSSCRKRPVKCPAMGCNEILPYEGMITHVVDIHKGSSDELDGKSAADADTKILEDLKKQVDESDERAYNPPGGV